MPYLPAVSNLRMISTLLKGEREAEAYNPPLFLEGEKSDMSFIVLINGQISESVQSK